MWVELTSSKKAFIMALAIVAVVVLSSLGRVPGTEALDFVKWVVVAWLGAQAYQEANKPPVSPA